MAVNDFDSIASFYDRLAKFVFGNALLDAQLQHLPEISERDHVLIIGGGTGEILEHIPLCEEVIFLEKSRKMIKRAEMRLVNRPIDFIRQDFFDFETDQKFDVILCPFFLDCFDEVNLEKAISKCTNHLAKQGSLVVIDFDEKRVHPFLLMTMMLFFRLFSKLQSKSLLPIRKIIQQNRFKEQEVKFLKKGVFSGVYIPEAKK